MTDEFKPTPKRLQELASEFLETPFGQYYMSQLTEKYSALHHEAEADDLTLSEAGKKVTKAAGVKIAMNWMLQKAAYEEDKAG